MLKFESLLTDSIPPVEPADLQRLRAFQSQHKGNQSVGLSDGAIRNLCNCPDADPLAVWARSAFLGLMFQEGYLANWSNCDELQPIVVEKAAVFPLPNGLHGVDYDNFIRNLSE